MLTDEAAIVPHDVWVCQLREHARLIDGFLPVNPSHTLQADLLQCKHPSVTCTKTREAFTFLVARVLATRIRLATATKTTKLTNTSG